jgi:hypothetical protein
MYMNHPLLGAWASGVLVAAALLRSMMPIPDAPTAGESLDVAFHNDFGEPIEVRVSGCMDKTFDYRGEIAVDSPDCLLSVRRQDGALWTPWTHPITPGAAGWDLVLPRVRTGGLGMTIVGTERGAEVRGVMTGDPAWQIGLERGDVVVSANHISLEGLETSEMIDAITGIEGSSVELRVVDVRTGRIVIRGARRALIKNDG